MSEPVIVLDQLAKTFGKTVAVDRLSMSVPAGEIFGFLGANWRRQDDDHPNALWSREADLRERNDRRP
jgi:hypothetical protein